MRNLQKDLNVIWQPPISRQTSLHIALPSPFFRKIFQTPSISFDFEEVEPPPL